jgi:hypothetical protein
MILHRDRPAAFSPAASPSRLASAMVMLFVHINDAAGGFCIQINFIIYYQEKSKPLKIMCKLVKSVERAGKTYITVQVQQPTP